MDRPVGLILDVQHVGRRGRTDRGAVWPPGSARHEDFEAARVLHYVAAATRRAHERGAPCVVLTQGSYPARHAYVDDFARRAGPGGGAANTWLYVACHLNVMPNGGGRFGLVAHDSRSALGRRFATGVAQALRDGPYRELPDVRLRAIGPAEAQEAWQRNVLSTYAGIWSAPANVAGICYEPAHLDDEALALDPDGLASLGRALVDGALRLADGPTA